MRVKLKIEEEHWLYHRRYNTVAGIVEWGVESACNETRKPFGDIENGSEQYNYSFFCAFIVNSILLTA